MGRVAAANLLSSELCCAARWLNKRLRPDLSCSRFGNEKPPLVQSSRAPPSKHLPFLTGMEVLDAVAKIGEGRFLTTTECVRGRWIALCHLHCYLEAVSRMDRILDDIIPLTRVLDST